MFRRTFLHGLLTTMVGATCGWKPPRAPVSVALTGEAVQRVFPARAALFAPPVVVAPKQYILLGITESIQVSIDVANMSVTEFTRIKLREDGFYHRITLPFPVKE